MKRLVGAGRTSIKIQFSQKFHGLIGCETCETAKGIPSSLFLRILSCKCPAISAGLAEKEGRLTEVPQILAIISDGLIESVPVVISLSKWRLWGFPRISMFQIVVLFYVDFSSWEIRLFWTVLIDSWRWPNGLISTTDGNTLRFVCSRHLDTPKGAGESNFAEAVILPWDAFDHTSRLPRYARNKQSRV